MKKIMYIHHSGIVGGAGVSLKNAVEAVAQDNVVFVYVSSDPNDMINILGRVDGNIHLETYGRRIGALTYYSGGDSLFSLRFWYRAMLILKQIKYWNTLIDEINPDTVIVNSKILAWMSSLSSVKKRNSICFVRETIKGRRHNLINSFIARRLEKFSRVVFLSDYDKRAEDLRTNNAIVIHNYVSQHQFDTTMTRAVALKELGLTDKGIFNVLYVGGVSEMKGFDLAVEAVCLLGERYRLIIAGNDFDDIKSSKDKNAVKYAEKWQSYIDGRTNKDQFCFVGRRSDMSSCYAACDVLIFPMREPHQSRPVFEAGAFRKPVIITDFDNISEFVKDEYNGFTVNKNNILQIADKIAFLKENPDKSRMMGDNNYRNTITKHDQKTNCAMIKDVIVG